MRDHEMQKLVPIRTQTLPLLFFLQTSACDWTQVRYFPVMLQDEVMFSFPGGMQVDGAPSALLPCRPVR